MIRTGEAYRAGLRDGREIWIDGERVADVTAHPAFKPIVDAKARMYDMAHDPASAPIMCFAEDGERFSTLLRPPSLKEHWHEKRRAIDLYLNDIGGVVTRVGGETVGEMWSLFDGRDVLNEIDPRFGDNIEQHIRGVLDADIFHVSANTDPKGDRSSRPQDYAGHRLTFVQFAQTPHFNHLAAVYNAFNFSGPLDFAKRAANLSDRVADG